MPSHKDDAFATTDDTAFGEPIPLEPAKPEPIAVPESIAVKFAKLYELQQQYARACLKIQQQRDGWERDEQLKWELDNRDPK